MDCFSVVAIRGDQIIDQFRLFHRTRAEVVEAILRDGFRDSEQWLGCSGSDLEGVFLSDIPVTCQDGAKGEALIEVIFDIPEHEISSQFEFLDEGQLFREFMVPAQFIREHAKLRLLIDEEIEELECWAVEVRLRRSVN